MRMHETDLPWVLVFLMLAPSFHAGELAMYAISARADG